MLRNVQELEWRKLRVCSTHLFSEQNGESSGSVAHRNIQEIESLRSVVHTEKFSELNGESSGSVVHRNDQAIEGRNFSLTYHNRNHCLAC